MLARIFKMGKSIDEMESLVPTSSTRRRGRRGSKVMLPSLSKESLAESIESSSTASNSSSSTSDCLLSTLEDDEPLRPSSRVQFSTVSIRTYSVTVGDTFIAKPYCLMLDWKHTPTVTMGIDRFEEQVATDRVGSRRRYLRGFPLPIYMPMQQRFLRLATVTGKSVAYLYRLEEARRERENAIPFGMCSSDEGFDPAIMEVQTCSRSKPYHLVDVDDYQLVEV